MVRFNKQQVYFSFSIFDRIHTKSQRVNLDWILHDWSHTVCDAHILQGSPIETWYTKWCTCFSVPHFTSKNASSKVSRLCNHVPRIRRARMRKKRSRTERGASFAFTSEFVVLMPVFESVSVHSRRCCGHLTCHRWFCAHGSRYKTGDCLVS